MDSLFLLIDGHSLAYRAYYAFAKAKKGPLRTSTGIPTSVCYGFLNSLFQLIDSYQPQLMAIALTSEKQLSAILLTLIIRQIARKPPMIL